MSLELGAHVTGPFAENTYVAIDAATRQAAVIDPGEGALAIWEEYADRGELTAILLTHAHLDHILGLRELKAAHDVPIWLHEEDVFWVERFQESAAMWMGVRVDPAPPPDRFWKHGDRFELGETTFEIRHTPGHSPGSVSLVWPEGVFTGDALFAGGIGRTDFPRSDFPTLERSIREQLYSLPDELPILPGHGGTSTIGDERKHNTFVRGI